jgi:pilus assembly protein Flp/PilA
MAMLTIRVMLRNLLSEEEGQDLVEYALIISLLALACISGVGSFGALAAAMLSAIGKAATDILG